MLCADQITEWDHEETPATSYDLSYPEDVFLDLVWLGDEGRHCQITGYSTEYCTVIPYDDDEEVFGFSSCEQDNSGCLDYMIGQSAGTEFPKEDCFVIVEDVTGAYIRGDGWTTDDDAELYIGGWRIATAEEAAMYCCGTSLWASEPENMA